MKVKINHIITIFILILVLGCDDSSSDPSTGTEPDPNNNIFYVVLVGDSELSKTGSTEVNLKIGDGEGYYGNLDQFLKGRTTTIPDYMGGEEAHLLLPYNPTILFGDHKNKKPVLGKINFTVRHPDTNEIIYSKEIYLRNLI